MNRQKALVIYAILFVFILAFDLWTKSAVFELLEVEIRHFEDRPPQVARQVEYPIFPTWLRLQATLNPGGFAGWFAGNMWFLIPVSTLAVVGTALMVGIPKTSRPVFVVCLGLIAGGAAGNLYDRALEGAVRDFIAVYYGSWRWPNFNVADSALCVGFAVLLISEIFGPKREEPKESEAEAAAAAQKASVASTPRAE